MWSSGAGSSGSSAAAEALASPSSSARACGVRAPRPVRPSIAASSTDQATSGPCAAGRRGRSQRTRATRDGTPVPEARPSPAGRAATWLSAIQRVSTRCGSTSPGERAFSVLPAASRDPTAPDVRGLASQARVRSVQRSAADFRAHASYPSVGSQLSGSSPGAPTASSPAVAASSTTKAAVRSSTCSSSARARRSRTPRPPVRSTDAGAEPQWSSSSSTRRTASNAAPAAARVACAGSWAVVTSSGGTSTGPVARLGHPAEQLGDHGEGAQPGRGLPDQGVVLEPGGRGGGPAGGRGDQPVDFGAGGLARDDQGM